MVPPAHSPDELRIGVLEPDATLDTHTAAYCRAAGSFETVPHRATTVSVSVGRARSRVVVDSGATGEGRFDLYVRMPRWRRRPTLRVAVDDGTSEVVFTARLRHPQPTRNGTYRGYTSTVAGRGVLDRLHGHGLEFGALHMPAPLDAAVATVEYADRLTREQAIEQFPELAADAERIVSPTVLLDLDRDDLRGIEAERYDFFVATDIIEHLADPIGFLVRLSQVMRPGTLLLLVVPDRDFTFDFRRRTTSWRHVEREHLAGVTSVDDDHVVEFLTSSTAALLPNEPERRRALIDEQRARSVHAHVWDQAAFDRFLDRAIDRYAPDLRVAHRVPSEDAGGAMVYLLRRT